MVTAPFSDSLCDVTMAKFIRTNKLPSSPTPTPTPPSPLCMTRFQCFN